MIEYSLRLHNNGDIDIVSFIFNIKPIDYKVVYHKSYYSSENLNENLNIAFKEWQRLTFIERKKNHCEF